MFLIKFLLFSILISFIPSLSGNVIPTLTDSQDANIAELPFLVSIQFRLIAITSHVCTGTLLNENFVLSAASCLEGRPLANLRMEYGRTIINPGNLTISQKVGVKELIYHPLFDNETRLNDLVILEADKAMLIEHLMAPYANLATPNSRFPSGTRAVHASWGHVALGVETNHLQRAEVTIISLTECLAKNDTRIPVRENICAIDASVLCSGDIGTPLIVNRVVVGIASFRNGPSCISTPGDFPNVYTAVSFYIGWIESVTGISYQVNTFLSPNM